LITVFAFPADSPFRKNSKLRKLWIKFFFDF